VRNAGEIPLSKIGARNDDQFWASGEPIAVDFSNLPAERTDEWITIVPYDSEAGKFGQWLYTGKKESGSLRFRGLAKGRYEVRYHYSNGDKEVRSRYMFRVE
jgi:hypothetical protein